MYQILYKKKKKKKDKIQKKKKTHLIDCGL